VLAKNLLSNENELDDLKDYGDEPEQI